MDRTLGAVCWPSYCCLFAVVTSFRLQRSDSKNRSRPQQHLQTPPPTSGSWCTATARRALTCAPPQQGIRYRTRLSCRWSFTPNLTGLCPRGQLHPGCPEQREKRAEPSSVAQRRPAQQGLPRHAWRVSGHQTAPRYDGNNAVHR